MSTAIPTVYTDSSFFVSLYLKDAHSSTALALVASRPRLWFTPLHVAECAHAFAQQVYFRKIAESTASTLYDQLERDRRSGIWLETPLPDDAFRLCADLARRHGPKFGLRTLDSLHVACALELKAERFWTFDDRQAKLAKAEGLKTQ